MELFTRTRTGMTLTPAGQALAGETPAVLAGWDHAPRETKAAASRADQVLRVGFMSSAANEATQQIIAAFTCRRPGWRVDLQQAAGSDPTARLASGDVGAALLRLPFPGQDDVRIEVLLTEPRWVVLPDTHPLADKGEIPFGKLWDEAWVAAIANGYGIALAPESAARYYARPGIAYRPVTGVSPSQAGVAWPPANDSNPVVQDFVRCCLDSKPAGTPPS